MIYDTIDNQLDWAYLLVNEGRRLVSIGFDDTHEVKISSY
ncbi:hypothetical protein STFR1_50002 [Bacillus vallismortis]